jgi:PilZ domain
MQLRDLSYKHLETFGIFRVAFQLHDKTIRMLPAPGRNPREERRTHARYPVKLALRFLIRSGKFVSVCGEGTSINISSTGMLFRTSKRLNRGETVIAAVEWPRTTDGKPTVLLFHGHVVWIKGSKVGISISHYGFLSEEIPNITDLEGLDRRIIPRHLTPTRANPTLYAGVRQWKRGVGQWK